MKVNTQWNLGRFNVALESEVTADVRDMLAGFGLRFLGQRNSEVDKILGGFVTNAKGKQERIKGFKRNEVAFTPELAGKLADSFAELGLPDSEATVKAIAIVGESTVEAADVKMPDERAAYARNAKASTLNKLAEKVGFDGEIGDGTAENAPVDFLRAIKAWSKAQVASI